MIQAVLVVVVTLVVVVWVRAMRRARLRWERRLNLPGLWHSASAQWHFSGGSGGGGYLISSPDSSERGRWRLAGNDILLEPETGGNRRYPLRLMQPGQISLQIGPDWLSLNKQPDNVVPLNQRSP